MEIYKKMYYRLFNSITDALAAMAQQNFGAAADVLHGPGRAHARCSRAQSAMVPNSRR